jgi:hypothetical protein
LTGALTLYDIYHHWDASQVAEVSHALASRARTSRQIAQELGNLPVFATWTGQSADTASAAIGASATKLELSAQECFRLAAGLAPIEEEVEQVTKEVKAIWAYSQETPVVDVDLNANTVIERDTSFLYPEAAEKLEAIAELKTRIAAVLAKAEEADTQLAQALAMSTGEEPVDADRPVEAPRAVPHAPAGASQQEVRKWWDSLSPGQRREVQTVLPDSIRNLDGIPPDVRSKLNMAALPREITNFQNGSLGRDGRVYIDQAKLADLKALRDTLSAHPGDSLILLDTTSNPFGVLAAVGVGDVDNAERVGVSVGGLNTRVSASVDEMVREAEAQRGKASELRRTAHVPNYDAVASIAWLGYQAPDSAHDVIHDDLARKGAGDLNSFYKGLAATSNIPDQQITAFGHSYGSLTTSLALQQGAPVSDVVLYGSPGGEITNAAQLGVTPGHAYYMVGVNDHVADAVPQLGAFGPGMQDVPGMTELSVNTGTAPGLPLGDGNLHERAYGHSEYPRDGSNGQLRMSGYNMAAVLAGLPDDIVKPRALPPPTIPSGPGPLGWPMPNPDYQP